MMHGTKPRPPRQPKSCGKTASLPLTLGHHPIEAFSATSSWIRFIGMKVFIAGATGATGRWLAGMLVERGHALRMVVRAKDRLPAEVRDHPAVELTEASLLDLPKEGRDRLVEGCDAVVSCLGHRLSFRGVFGPPWRLVTRATRQLAQAIEASEPAKPVRFILMNTAGNRNRDLDEHLTFGEHVVLGLLRLCIPPHADNEQAAEFLRAPVAKRSTRMEWVVVRPDTLVDASEVSPYTLHPSPKRSALFNPGKTSRINVAAFMVRLIEDDGQWAQWRGRMPVIYNDDRSET